jgi:hypothetical protein
VLSWSKRWNWRSQKLRRCRKRHRSSWGALLERIESLAELRAEVEIGIRELDAGLGEEIDIEDVIRLARAEHAGRT